LDTPLHALEPKLFCEACSQSSKWKQRAHVVGLTCETPPTAEALCRQGFVNGPLIASTWNF
jgi:hypothetical protein